MFLDWFLDRSIYFSFDKTGYIRHKKKFTKTKLNGKNKTALVTGANSGIGLAITKALIHAKARVIMVCRNKEKGNLALQEVKNLYSNADINLLIADLSESKSIKNLIEQITSPIDILIHNAGTMPNSLLYNSNGKEMIWATQVIGPYLLTSELIKKKLLSPCGRIITVSSGGMYTKKLDLTDLNWKKNLYNKYKAYANAKRAQIILNEFFAKIYNNHYIFSCMHPGWVDTPGVKHSMPKFYSWMKKRLRTPEQGCDTVIYLSLIHKSYPGGKFWFDRKIVSTHIIKKTLESQTDRKIFWETLQQERI